MKKLLPFTFITLSIFCLNQNSYGQEADSPIQVHGDNVEYFHALGKVVGTGHVSIDHEGARLEADKITYYVATKTAVAEGHVVLRQKGSVYRGEKAEYDFQKNAGNVSKMDAEIGHNFFGKSDRIQKVSEDHYRCAGGYLTTCPGDKPIYRLQAQQVDVYPGRKVVVRNALLFVGGVPLFFLPYYSQHFVDFDRAPVQFVPGKSSEWGFFLLSKWRYHLRDTPGLTSWGNVLADYREKRGFGMGLENFYKGKRLGRGGIRTYYIDDQAPPAEDDPHRFRVQVRHQAKVGPSTTLTTEFNRLSDPEIVKNFFFREEYEANVFPDNYVSLITAKPEYTFSILERARVDDFYTVVERNPELRLDTHNRQFAQTPYYIRAEYQGSVLSKKFADSEMESDANRFDTNHTLSYAGHVGAWSLTPRLGTRQTYYSRGNDADRDLVRGTFDPGLDVSARFFRTYDTTIRAWGLDYHQIRHIFSPTASYHWRPEPTQSKSELQSFDSIDSLEKQNVVRFAFENKLQTKQPNARGELAVREIARVVPSIDFNLYNGRLENLFLDAESNPYPWMGINTETTYDTGLGKVETANVDFWLRKGNVGYALGQRYLREESSQTTTQLEWRINSQWSTKIYERYEFEEKRSQEFELRLSRYFECLIVDFTYNHRQGAGDTFYFAVRLTAFPSASLGLGKTYNSPGARTRDSWYNPLN